MMKRFLLIITCSLLIITLFSCQNKNKKLLVKKWDCIKVDNLDPVNTKYQSPEDSAKTAMLEASLKTLSWSFNADGSYNTSAAERTITQGEYTYDDKLKTLTCTTASKNTINQYNVDILTESDLVLSSDVNNKKIVLHFSPSP